MKRRLLIIAAVVLFLLPNVTFGQTAPNLGTTSSFAFFSGTGAFDVVGDATTVTGDVGTHTGAFNGFPPGELFGTKHVTDAISALAAADVLTAYAYMRDNLTCGHDLVTPILTQTLSAPGVYCVGTAAVLAGDLTLDGGGNPDAKFYFKIDGAFSTNGSTKIILTNGTKWSNVYWQINGAFASGGSSVFMGTILATGAITLNASTLYGRGLSTTGAINLNAANGMLPPLLTVTTTQVDAGCSPTGSATAWPVGGVQPYSYLWNTVPVQTTKTAIGLAAGNYTVTVTDYAGSIAIANVTIKGASLTALLTSQVNVSCFGSTGSVVITPSGGTPPYVITPAQTGLSPGLHTFTVTDANLCTTTVDATITGPATGLTALLTSQVNVSCFGNNTGSATVTASGGTGVYTYSWNTIPVQTTATANNLSSGNYIVTVTDNSGCIATANVSIQQPLAALTVSTTQIDVLCFGNSSASATALPQGGSAPYSYSWNTIPVQTTATANNLSAGNYIVTVTDNSGCIATANVSIQQPLAALMVSTTKVDVQCFGGSSGSATALPQGGSAPYSYSWNTVPVQTTATASNLSSGNYTVTVTDNSGCVATANVTINPAQVPNAPLVTVIQPDCYCSCAPLTNGTGTITVTVQNAGETYSFDNGVTFQTSNTKSGLAAGNYNVIIKSPGGCNSPATLVTINPQSVTASPTAILIQPTCLLSTGTITVNVQHVGETYSFDNGVTFQISNTKSGLAPGNYNVMIKSPGGCDSPATLMTINPAPVSLNAPVTTVIQPTCTVTTGTITVTVQNAGEIYYSFDNGLNFQSSNTKTGLPAGNYNVIIKSPGGCNSPATPTTINPAPVSPNAPVTTVIQPTCSLATGTITVTVQNASDTYSFDNGVTFQTSNTKSGLVAGNYNVIIKSTGGCNSPATPTTINPAPVSPNAPVTTVIQPTGSVITGTIIVTAPTGTGMTYSIDGSTYTTTSVFTEPSGTYSITAKNSAGCISPPTIVTILAIKADLSVVKTVNDDHPIIKQKVVFTIIATNNGPFTATGVTVNDMLQSGYTYVSSTTTVGTYDPSTGIWTIGTLNIGASESLTITATVISLGNYSNTATITGNELDENTGNNTSTVITYPTDFFIPDGFSPNGDGINDLFVIRGIANYPNNTFVIFNRWGNKVFEASPYQNNWDGRSMFGLRVGGDELPIGTYFYTLDLKDGSAIFKGTIYLNR